MRVRQMIDGRQELAVELFQVRFDAANRDSTKSYAMISALAPDEPNALRLALRLPVGKRDLQRCINRFRARVAEEDAVDAIREHVRELSRELERERVAH